MWLLFEFYLSTDIDNIRRKVFKTVHKWKVISKLTSSLRQEQVLSLRMRIVVNTILNSLIKEFIKLIANYSKGYKKLINSSLLFHTHRVNLSQTFTTKYPPPIQRHTEQEI